MKKNYEAVAHDALVRSSLLLQLFFMIYDRELPGFGGMYTRGQGTILSCNTQALAGQP